MSSNYLRAFTILETLISLLLMSIIITLTYTIYNVVEKQMMRYQNEHHSVLQYNLFNTAFKNDIYNSEDFSVSNSSISLMFYDDSTIVYHFMPNHILRETIVKTDTFKLPTINHKLLGEGADTTSYLFKISTELMGEPIEANYILHKNLANTINDTYFK